MTYLTTTSGGKITLLVLSLTLLLYWLTQKAQCLLNTVHESLWQTFKVMKAVGLVRQGHQQQLY